MMRQDKPCPPGERAGLMHRLGHFSVVLSVVGAGSAVTMPGGSALAASRPMAHSGHGHSVRAASRHLRNPARGARKRSVARIVKAGHVTFHSAALHRDVVPLANTVWDNPAIPPGVMSAIQSAARESGVDPQLLAAIAWRESRFDPNAGNQHSSAKGLLQFTTGTWLQVVRNYGSEHNAGRYAAAIHRDQSGALLVSGKQMRTTILRLRNDPVLSAKLAAKNMSQQREAMQAWLGRSVTPADLYLTHVLGPSGAVRFLTAAAQHPNDSSLKVGSYDVMRNAGLLARDGRPMTVANTYAAAEAMLEAHRTRSGPDAPRERGDAANVIQVSEAP